jgi:dTDP-4-dehydrorhamnose reductase
VKVAVIGPRGQLGSALCEAFRRRAVDCVELDHGRVEVTDPQSVLVALRDARPAAVVNTAAFHKVDACEEDPKRAFEVNALGALHVARACREAGARCVYVSTDYVFDGAKAERYREEDLPNPVNVYGASKLAGEHLVVQTCPDALVVRVASLFGGLGSRGKGTNFVLTVLERARRGEALRVVDDVRMSPTYAEDAAAAIVELVARGALRGLSRGEQGRVLVVRVSDARPRARRPTGARTPGAPGGLPRAGQAPAQLRSFHGQAGGPGPAAPAVGGRGPEVPGGALRPCVGLRVLGLSGSS